MLTDKFGQQIYSESDLIQYIMSGRDLDPNRKWLVDDSVDSLESIRWIAESIPQLVHYTHSDCSIEEFDSKCQSTWLMPTKYKELDIAKHVLDLCTNDAELQRAGEELLLYADRNLLDLLKFLVYLVEEMRANSIVWGVGRGSSVASFVLYLLGVHRVNSLYYDLDIKEFLR